MLNKEKALDQESREKPVLLIIDDNLYNLKIIGHILIKSSYKISLVSDSKKAFDAARKIMPDLILLDIVMPEIDGFEICRRLKENQDTRDIPVIFLTANRIQADDVVKGFESGAVDYVAKPFKPEELLMRINTHLELKRLRDKLEMKVKNRTENLLKANKELEDVNTTISVLLQKREKDRRDLEESIMVNVKNLIMPYIDKFKASSLNSYQRICIEQIEASLNDLVSPFSRKLSSSLYSLTPSEIRVASLIKDGKTTKEIAEFLNISESGVVFHRNNIRKKLRLINKHINLRTFLQSLQ